MKYSDIVDLVMSGAMGYVPNDSENFSLLFKTKFEDMICDGMFFYGISDGVAKGPWRVLLFDSEKQVILKNVDDVLSFYHAEELCACELEKKDIDLMLELEEKYEAAFDAVADRAFLEFEDEEQRESAKALSELLKENAGNLYEMYKLVASDFIGWMEGR